MLLCTGMTHEVNQSAENRPSSVDTLKGPVGLYQDLAQRLYTCRVDPIKPHGLQRVRFFKLSQNSSSTITPSRFSTIRVMGLSVCPCVPKSRHCTTQSAVTLITARVDAVACAVWWIRILLSDISIWIWPPQHSKPSEMRMVLRCLWRTFTWDRWNQKTTDHTSLPCHQLQKMNLQNIILHKGKDLPGFVQVTDYVDVSENGNWVIVLDYLCTTGCSNLAKDIDESRSPMEDYLLSWTAFNLRA